MPPRPLAPLSTGRAGPTKKSSSAASKTSPTGCGRPASAGRRSYWSAQGSMPKGRALISTAPRSRTCSAGRSLHRREQMPPRKLREPSMPPSMEKVKGQKLRTGWTTGTCAAAAAKAAASALASGRLQTRVDVKLPGKGRKRRVEFEVERCDLSDSWAEAVVIKDAGDDPDVTDGAYLTARVSWRGEKGGELGRGGGGWIVTQ